MLQITQKHKTIVYYINAAVCLLFMFGFGYLNPYGSLEKIGMQVLGIFIGMLYGWTTCGFVWPSLLGLIALGFSEYASINDALSAGFGNVTVTILILFLCIITGYFNKSGLSEAIAYWFICRKCAINRPYIFTAMFFLAAYVIGASVSLFASILLLWSILYKVCDLMGFQKGDKWVVVTMAGIVYCTMLGYTIFPFKPMAMMIINALQTASNGLTINFIPFTITSTIVSFVCLIAYVLVCKFIIRPDVSKLMTRTDYFAEMREKKASRAQKVAGLVLVLFFFAMLAPSVLPKGTALYVFFNMLGTTGSLIFILAVLAILRDENGQPFFNFHEAAKSVNWDMILMMASTMPVAAALSAKEVGITPFIVEIITPLFSGMSAVIFAILFLTICLVLTQFAHNLILAVLIEPILYGFCVNMGVNPVMLTVLFAFALNIAVATPAGSAAGALLYTNRDWIKTKYAYQYGVLIVAITLVVIVLVGLPVSSLIFGF